MTERAFYTIKEFCERHAISRTTFYRLQLPVLKLSPRRILVPADCVLPTSIPTTKRKITGNNLKQPEILEVIKYLRDREK